MYRLFIQTKQRGIGNDIGRKRTKGGRELVLLLQVITGIE
jgi:hypothetical protein